MGSLPWPCWLKLNKVPPFFIRDPKVVCHPCIALVTDLVWPKLARKSFLLNKLVFLFTLVVFIVSQSILKEFEEKEAVPRSSPRARSPSFFWA